MKMPMLLSSLLLAAVPLAAQAPAQHHAPMAMPMMGMMQEMMGPMHRSMAFNPAGLLERAEVLGLTQQQSARLTQIRDAAKTAHDAAHNDAMQHGTALGKALATSDTAQVRAHFAGHHDAMGRAHLLMLQASIQAKAVLTDAQRARVEGWADAMEMHGRMGPGGGTGMPMHMHQGPQQRP